MNSSTSDANFRAGQQATIVADSDYLPFHRKLTYAFTDGAGNLLYCIISSYMLYFFTNIFGLSIGVAGTLLLIGRFIDAIGAPTMGILVDHTNSKYGKSRPWFLWMAIPFALFVWLLFTTPDWSGGAKVAYAGIMYVLADLSYTAISTPITSVLPNLTNDTNERNSANSIRMAMGNVGNFFAVTFIIPFAELLGRGNNQRGWSIGVGIYSIVALIMLVVAFLDMREKNLETEKVLSIKESFKAAKNNWPWMFIVGANLLYWAGYMVRNSSMAYYFQYNMNSKGLISLFNGFSIIQVIGMLAVPYLAKYLNKWGATSLMLALTIVGQIWMGLSGKNVFMLMVGWCIACIGAGSACTMFFAMASDTVDYGEWKNGIRAPGFLTAIAASFCIQMGSGLGSYVCSQVLNFFGFAAGHQQSAQSLFGIRITFIWVPIIIYALSLIIMIFYRKWENHEPVVKADLDKIHAAEQQE